MLTPRGHPHLGSGSFFRYYTFQQPDYVYPQPEKTKSCKDKFLDNLGHFFCFFKSE